MVPLDITIREIPNSVAVENKIRQKADKLSQYCRKVEFCKVVVGLAQNQHHKGKLYTTHIEVGVPGKVLVVTHRKNEDLYVLIRNAFAAINRQVKRYTEEKKGHVKTHPQLLSGRIARIFTDYGFIETVDGVEYYFHASNTLNHSFEKMDIGSPVSFLNGGAGDSLQASHVSVMVEVEEQVKH